MSGRVVMTKLPITSCPYCGLLNHPNSFYGGMFKLNTKSDADSWLHLLSQVECNGHTVHMLTQWHLLPPLTGTVKSSLFTHAHSSLLSLAAKLHPCRTNYSHYVNNGWTDRICVLSCGTYHQPVDTVFPYNIFYNLN